MEEIILDMYNNLNTRDREQFKNVSNKLLSNCFICGKIESNKNDYYFILRNKNIISEYFSPLGFNLEINEEYKCIQLVNTLNHNRTRFTIWESIVILILRAIYDEKIREISLYNEVVINIGDIQEKITALKIRDKLIDKVVLNNTLRMLKKFNIITNLDSDLTMEDTRLIIHPTILMAIRVDDIREVYNKLKNYKKGDEDSEEVEENQAD